MGNGTFGVIMDIELIGRGLNDWILSISTEGAEIRNDPNWLALPIGIGLLQEAAEDLQPELLPWG
jgi:hypothetical protein